MLTWTETMDLFDRAYSIITNKDDLHKENARTKQVLKGNGYQESIISKILKRVTNNHSLPQSQQQAQAADIQKEEIRMSINLPYVGDTSEKLRRRLRSHKIRSTSYTENTLSKLYCKPKDRVATEDKSSIVYESDCSNHEEQERLLLTCSGFFIDNVELDNKVM